MRIHYPDFWFCPSLLRTYTAYDQHRGYATTILLNTDGTYGTRDRGTRERARHTTHIIHPRHVARESRESRDFTPLCSYLTSPTKKPRLARGHTAHGAAQPQLPPCWRCIGSPRRGHSALDSARRHDHTRPSPLTYSTHSLTHN